MRTIGQKCGWVIPRGERRVHKLLRTHTRECDQQFVTQFSVAPGYRRSVRILVQFAQEELSAFQPAVQMLVKSA